MPLSKNPSQLIVSGYAHLMLSIAPNYPHYKKSLARVKAERVRQQ